MKISHFYTVSYALKLHIEVRIVASTHKSFFRILCDKVVIDHNAYTPFKYIEKCSNNYTFNFLIFIELREIHLTF